jgi:hypothetical protein
MSNRLGSFELGHPSPILHPISNTKPNNQPTQKHPKMVKPLTFKGDKPKKRKHRATHADDDPSSSAPSKTPRPSTTPKDAAGA